MYEIEEFYQRTAKEADEERKRILIECGIFDKKYSTEKSADYPFYDEKMKRYYRKIAVSVSDEDYKNVLDYYNNRRKIQPSGAEKTLSAIAVVVLVFSLLCFASGVLAAVIDAGLIVYAVVGVVSLIHGLAAWALFRVICNISVNIQ